MSVFVGTYLESFENMLSKTHPNTYWSMFRLADRYGFMVRLGFKVGEEMWKIELEIDEMCVKEKGLSYIYPAVNKLLAQKEPSRICVKFWTGVEIWVRHYYSTPRNSNQWWYYRKRQE